MSTVLFGIDVLVLLYSLAKMLKDKVGWSENTASWVRAAIAALVVVVIGLQAEGVILGPETETWVVMALTALSVFLASLGYGPDVVGTIRAMSDLVRLQAFEHLNLWVASMLVEDGELIKAHMAMLEKRYHMSTVWGRER